MRSQGTGGSMKTDSTYQSVSWFAALASQKALTLDPPFQRKPVWSTKQRSALIETLLLDLPVPEIFMQARFLADGTSIHVVVDGQQRIRTILKFLSLDQADNDDNGFELELDPTSEWNSLGFNDFGDEAKVQFFSRSLAVRMLDPAASKDAIKDVFKRFNKYLLPLTPQELRHAAFEGPLVRIATQLADEPYWIAERLVTPQAVRRMKDVEFVSDLLIGTLYGPQAGNASTLDKYYRLMESFDEELPEQDDLLRRFHSAQAIIQTSFTNLRGTRWGNRTDFYTLFVAIAELLRERRLLEGTIESLTGKLAKFAADVNVRLGNEHVEMDDEVIAYVRAVEKGASDRSRRLARHDIMLRQLDEYFSPA